MNEELKKQIAEIELDAKKRIEEICKKAIEKAEKSSKLWEPKYGDVVCYWSYSNEEPCFARYHNDNYLICFYEAGELFPTEEACKEAHKAKVIQTKWKRLAAESGEEDNPWDGSNEHWSVHYDIEELDIYYKKEYRFTAETTFFASEEAINAAVAEIGEKNIKKYILGIK